MRITREISCKGAKEAQRGVKRIRKALPASNKANEGMKSAHKGTMNTKDN